MTNIVAARAWQVFDDTGPRFHGMCLQEIGEGSGPLTSWAPPPPGGEPVLHPFLSARTDVTNYESRLRRLLEQSTCLMDYLFRIKQDGLRLEMISPARRWRILRAEAVVAEISDTPAFLAPSSSGQLADTPIDRQFLSLNASTPEDRDRLCQKLGQSDDLPSFLDRLAEAGYQVTALTQG